ncbi:MAG: TolC family protein [Bacteroidales bacterium]
MRKRYLIPLLLLSAMSALGQEKWTLRQCIEYAIENNIDIRSRMIEKENQEIQLNTAKMSRLPNLNAGASEHFGFGRSTTREGTTEDNTSSSTSFNLQTSLPVFTGFRIPNEIKAKKFDLAAAIEDLNKAKEDLSLNITGFYLQSLFAKELLTISIEQVRLSKEQLVQTEQLVKNGKSPISQLYETQAQLAKDELTLTESENNVMLALLDLSQVLNLPNEKDFDIETPDIAAILVQDMKELLNPMEVYDYSVSNRPGIKAAQYRLESSLKNLNIAKSNYYPSLSLSAGYSNSYYYSYNLPEGMKNLSFRDQLKNNGSESLGLSLSIPIFNRFATRNQVKQARLSIDAQKLQLLNAKQNLFKEIQQAYFNASASESKFKSAAKAVEASRIAYEHEELKYRNGRSTTLELNNAQVRLERSLAEEAQAKYDYVFRSKILDFYNGKPLYFE